MQKRGPVSNARRALFVVLYADVIWPIVIQQKPIDTSRRQCYSMYITKYTIYIKKEYALTHIN